MQVKVCKECGRINPLGEETCIGCSSDDFDELNLTPSWDSIEAYTEEED